MEKFFDSHCHLFTRKETLNLHLIIQIILSLPDIFKPEEDQTENALDEVKKKKNQLKRIINFIKVGFSGSEGDIFDKMNKVYADRFCVAPLMFDLECCFIKDRAEGLKSPQIDTAELKNQFEKTISNFHSFHQQKIDEANLLLGASNLSSVPPDISSDLQEYHDLIEESKGLLSSLNQEYLETDNFVNLVKDNFELQLNDIIELQKEKQGVIFPFFAIDPRRDGVIDRYINEIYPLNIFTGVKLYCPNGYSPTDDDLLKPGGLYDFCQKNNIPITAHNSHAGFASPLKEIEIFGSIYLDGKIKPVHEFVEFQEAFTTGWITDRAEKLNNPLLWNEVLKIYPKLKLNLAHFGAGSTDWQKNLSDMLTTYENFYTDLSCWTDYNELQKFVTNTFPKFKNKVLYGSDYYLDLLFINSFQEYVNNFFFDKKSLFSSSDFELIARTNAKKFLNIK